MGLFTHTSVSFFLALAYTNGVQVVGAVPTSSPTLKQVDYEPGRLEVFENEMYLSKGLTVRVLARQNEPVKYINGQQSTDLFHTMPDGAAVFKDGSDENPGGWLYVSNSEADFGQGGAGAMKMDANGNVIGYERLLSGTNRNCNGGKTDWESWISCEEDLGRQGKCWQVDPFGKRPPETIALGSQGGTWETFAHDTRDPNKLVAFLTEDEEDGALQRMTYINPNYTNPWDILLQPGSLDYLILEAESIFDYSHGTFQWTTDLADAKRNAIWYYSNLEGMKMDDDGILRIVSKGEDGFFNLDLDKGTYTFEVPNFDGQVDQSTTTMLDDGSKLIYFTEEAAPVSAILGAQVGIHTRNEAGEYCTILYGDNYSAETTGIAFSPGGERMYFAYQTDGILFEVTRTDGLSFFARTGTPVTTEEEWSFTSWISNLFSASRKAADGGPF